MGQCAQMVPSVLPLSPCYTPICRLISTCLYFFHSSFVIYSCLLFRFQPLGSDKIRYICWNKMCLTKMECVQILFFKVFQTKCNEIRWQRTHTLPDSYINAVVKITCHYITGENMGYKPDIAASSVCWQGLKRWYLGKAVIWHKKPVFETPLE